MRLRLPLVALAFVAACSKSAQAPEAASDQAAPGAASSASPAPAQPAHHWAAVQDKQYLYYSHVPAEGGAPGEVQTTTVRYLGQTSDGAYVIAEVEGRAMVVASCTLPCTMVRLRGQGLDQTVPLGGDSVVKAALDDAIAGQLEPYPLPKRQ